MKRISIERYKTLVDNYAGLIEGETDDGHKWIIFVDKDGRPVVFWPKRDPSGATVGEPIPLTTTNEEKTRQLTEDQAAA